MTAMWSCCAPSGASGLDAEDEPRDRLFVGIASLRHAADTLEAYQVPRPRDAGWTWAEIGKAVGISAEAAHKKHAGPRPR